MHVYLLSLANPTKIIAKNLEGSIYPQNNENKKGNGFKYFNRHLQDRKREEYPTQESREAETHVPVRGKHT